MEGNVWGRRPSRAQVRKRAGWGMATGPWWRKMDGWTADLLNHRKGQQEPLQLSVPYYCTLASACISAAGCSHTLWNGLSHMRTQKYTSNAIFNFTSWWEWVRSHDLKIWDSNTAVALWLAEAKRRGLCWGERHWTVSKSVTDFCFFVTKPDTLVNTPKPTKPSQSFSTTIFQVFEGEKNSQFTVFIFKWWRSYAFQKNL